MRVKERKTAAELRQIILDEVMSRDVCPGGIDLIIEKDEVLGWTVGTMFPGAIYGNCVAAVQQACSRLRGKYELKVEPKNDPGNS
jgi:hypothetical protein